MQTGKERSEHRVSLLAELFFTFARIGLFTFGGGYAMIPMIEHICVEKKKWISRDDMMNITVIAESTPGPIAVNCATFVGYRQRGIAGALAATFGVVLPSFVIIYLIAMLLDNFLAIPLITNAFRGIRIAVGILILGAAVRMIKTMHKKPLERILIVCAAVSMLFINVCSLNFSSISLMLIAGSIGLAVFFLQERNQREGSDRG